MVSPFLKLKGLCTCQFEDGKLVTELLTLVSTLTSKLMQWNYFGSMKTARDMSKWEFNVGDFTIQFLGQGLTPLV
jgi:hypothetical protein